MSSLEQWRLPEPRDLASLWLAWLEKRLKELIPGYIELNVQTAQQIENHKYQTYFENNPRGIKAEDRLGIFMLQAALSKLDYDVGWRGIDGTSPSQDERNAFKTAVYNGTVDSLPSSIMKAVYQFQKDHGLGPDGKAGPQTFAELARQFSKYEGWVRAYAKDRDLNTIGLSRWQNDEILFTHRLGMTPEDVISEQNVARMLTHFGARNIIVGRWDQETCIGTITATIGGEVVRLNILRGYMVAEILIGDVYKSVLKDGRLQEFGIIHYLPIKDIQEGIENYLWSTERWTQQREVRSTERWTQQREEWGWAREEPRTGTRTIGDSNKGRGWEQPQRKRNQPIIKTGKDGKWACELDSGNNKINQVKQHVKDMLTRLQASITQDWTTVENFHYIKVTINDTPIILYVNVTSGNLTAYMGNPPCPITQDGLWEEREQAWELSIEDIQMGIQKALKSDKLRNNGCIPASSLNGAPASSRDRSAPPEARDSLAVCREEIMKGLKKDFNMSFPPSASDSPRRIFGKITGGSENVFFVITIEEGLKTVSVRAAKEGGHFFPVTRDGMWESVWEYDQPAPAISIEDMYPGIRNLLRKTQVLDILWKEAEIGAILKNMNAGSIKWDSQGNPPVIRATFPGSTHGNDWQIPITVWIDKGSGDLTAYMGSDPRYPITKDGLLRKETWSRWSPTLPIGDMKAGIEKSLQEMRFIESKKRVQKMLEGFFVRVVPDWITNEHDTIGVSIKGNTLPVRVSLCRDNPEKVNIFMKVEGEYILIWNGIDIANAYGRIERYAFISQSDLDSMFSLEKELIDKRKITRGAIVPIIRTSDWSGYLSYAEIIKRRDSLREIIRSIELERDKSLGQIQTTSMIDWKLREWWYTRWYFYSDPERSSKKKILDEWEAILELLDHLTDRVPRP